MDNKSCHSSGDSSSTTSSSTNNKDQYLRYLNKISHKISKSKPTFDHNRPINQRPPVPPPAPPPPPPPQPQSNQPPVYNINKSDFRDVVQKLTGSPAHERFSTPPPILQPKPPSSRLQRIRPPPLAQISNRPPPPLPNNAGSFVAGQRPVHPPLSPLPPFPAVHAAAESPISAYMRYLQSSTPTDFDPKRFPIISPLWNNFGHSSAAISVNQSQYVIPTSPVAFGCLASPRSPYPALFSPTAAGQLGFQQVASPRWKER